MKRFVSLGLLVLAVAVAPLGAMADDVKTPAQCSTTLGPDVVVGSSPGRGSVCVGDGNSANGNEVYVGGDVSQPCGRVEVAGNVIIEGGTNGGDNPDPATYCHS